MLHPAALLTAEESRAADQAVIAAGTSGEALMETAGSVVVDVIAEHFKPCPTLVICGTGNNGGDGFIIARMLTERGWKVTVALIGNAAEIKGDALAAQKKWHQGIASFSPSLLGSHQLIVDALFGTGLTRALDSEAKSAVQAINATAIPVVAVDIASGINADDGSVMGAAIEAAHTVTFVRAKPGQLLLPGKAHTGMLHIADIGIDGEKTKPTHFLNAPPLWRAAFPQPGAESHKYSRGHALVMGGDKAMTGASRLAAVSALRAGAGAVSVVCSAETLPIYAASLTAVMTKPIVTLPELQTLMEDKRVTASLIGPGCGNNESTREKTLHLLGHKKPCVLDADALSAFALNTKPLFAAINGPTVLTPHEGEFEALFKEKGGKVERAKAAAKKSGAVVVLKGNDTVIADPDGRVAINANAPPWLATAGSGDVLGGIIAGLLAQGMGAFDAACAGVWLHGEAARLFGRGLIAEDLPNTLPKALQELFND